MTVVELTRQQLDPAGTFVAHQSTGVLGLATVAWAFVMSIVGGDPAGRPVLVSAALLSIAAAAVWLVRSANPLRAPFRRRSMVTVYLFALAAMIFSTLASIGYNESLSDDWAPVCIALLTIAMSPYRPAREMLVSFGAMTILMGLVSVVKIGDFRTEGPGEAYIVVTLAPMLAVGIASIRYSHYLVEGMRSWQRRAEVAAATLATDMAGGVALSVEREHLSILSRDVAPFFTDLLGRDSITSADRTRARRIADSMRSLMVADANRTWLAIAFQSTSRGDRFVSIDDPDFIAGEMDVRQRTALRATILAMIDDELVSGIDVQIRVEGPLCRLTISLRSGGGPTAAIAADYDTYFSVLRVVFSAFAIDVEEQTVTVRLDYGRS